ncbi:ABC transporter permease [Shewanella sp. SR44-3]|uniref:ABC transporter permease n=1 Tax=Shewanella sp. SR44-3 TaxID=2760936 RepID=UPI0015FB11A5|nr:ABC transporter permease [Shewanella sp. SR44-3]MBB1268765.1 ABC transporter permease [Shewanella sp. SR44-3]
MLNNYLLTALRSMLRQKSHSLMNIMGLSIGLAAAILIALYVNYHQSFDKFQPEPTSSYRLQQQWPSMGLHAPLVSSAFNSELSKINGVELVFNLFDLSKQIDSAVEYQGEKLHLSSLFAASDNIEQLMLLPTVAGDLQQALTAPYQLALSVKEAQRLFGRSDVIGKSLQSQDASWTVAAIFENLPDNTHFHFDALTSANPAIIGTPSMGANNSYTYVRLANSANVDEISKTLTSLYNNLAYSGQDMVRVELQRLDKIHLNAQSQFEMKMNGSQFTVTVCTGLSLLLIGIAMINFINMSTAQAGRRAQEVGVKKAMGASQFQLISQFLFESTLLSFISVMIATLLVQLTLPWFNNLTESHLSLTASVDSLLVLAFLTLIIGITAGLYPALFMSSFSAKRVLSGDLQRGKTAVLIRKSLLTLQAALSVGLIVAAAILFQQLDYLKQLPVGYERTQRIEISAIAADMLFEKSNNAIVSRLSRIEGVSDIGFSDASLTDTTNTSTKLLWPGADADSPFLPFIGSGYGIVKAQGLKLLAGRDFSEKYGSDWYQEDAQGQGFAGIIVTESIIKMSGLTDPQQAIGKIWQFKTGKEDSDKFDVKIVGVVADIQVGSARNSLSPLLFICGLSWMSEANIVATITQDQLPLTLNRIKTELAQQTGNDEFTISLVEENYRQLYSDDRRVANFVLIFCGLAVFLTCVGIFGLSSYSAQCRAKEMSIRKVLGATKLDLINLLAKEYLWLLAVSIFLAVPATYYLLGQWLNGFNERITQPLSAYVAAAALVSLITWLTVASHGIKSASERPAKILKAE